MSLVFISAVADANWLTKGVRACWQVFNPPPITHEELIKIEKGQIYYDGIPVTRDFYPLETILRALNLKTDEEFNGAAVTSVGEGFSPLAKFLTDHGADLTVVDPAYVIRNMDYSSARDANTISEFFEIAARFVANSANFTGLDANSQDLVVSHAVVGPMIGSYWGILSAIGLLDECVKIVRVGGEIRVAGFAGAHIDIISAYLNKAFPGIQFTWSSYSREWTTPMGHNMQNSGRLLTITKPYNIPKAHVEFPRAVRIMM